MRVLLSADLLGHKKSQQLNEQLRNSITNRSLIIGFSGIDGSGKSTQIVHLNSLFQELGLQTYCGKTVFHGLESVFRLSEKMFGDPYAYHPTIPSTLREFVVACDVVKYYTDYVEPHLNTNKVILLDRCNLCYLVYAQAYDADLSWIKPMYKLVPEPDLILLFDTPIHISQQRLQHRFEKPLQSDEQSHFLNSVRNHYLNLAKTKDNVHIIDATRSQEEVLTQICNLLIDRVM